MIKKHSTCIYFTCAVCPGMIESPTGQRFEVNPDACGWHRPRPDAGDPASPLEVMLDRHGNKFVPVSATLPGETCLVTTCPSNTGAKCELSRYDHPDGVNPNRCYHRQFVLRGEN